MKKAIVVWALLLSACSTMPKSWSHNASGSQQHQADQAECMALANTAKMGVTVGAAHQIDTIYESCMRGKGYYR